jgi:hypothetical protein
VATARNVVFATTSSFDLENSYGQASLTGDVFGWYTIALSSTVCDYSTLASQARAAATAAGVNLSNYSRYVYAFPSNACGWWGLGTVGGNPSSAWINGSLQLAVVGHEMGHNFGLYHSHALECGTVPIGTGCTSVEYGDPLDIMGSSYQNHFNAFQKERLGWLNYGSSPPITTVTSSGTYPIDPFETVGAGPKALKIPIGTTGNYYYVEWRRPAGFDAGLSGNPNVMNGVVLHQASPSNGDSSKLLDMTATSSWSDPALIVGQSFTDAAALITITPISITSTNALVTVSMGSSGCTRANPTIALSPTPSAGVAAGTAVSFTATVTNNDTAGCGASTFDLTDTVPAGWSATLASTALALSPGTSGSTTLQVTSTATATSGSYPVNATAKNRGATSYQASATATYVVSTATCARANPTVTLAAPTLPAAGVVAGTPVSYNVSVTNKDSSACAASTFDLTSSVPSGWTATAASPALSLSPGASSSTTLQVTSPTPTASGTYTINATAKNRGATSYLASASATYTVSSTADSITGSFSDNFDRADSTTTIGATWSIGAGKFVISGNKLKNAPQVGNAVAVVSALTGATQTAGADFTSVDNNLGPRFGIVLRYKDSKNYYLIYRQTGGSSRLLISKFVNGVETVLKYASVSNPAKNVPFRITGRITGSTLSLDFAGVTNKVTVTDSAGTFATGKAGIMIGPGGSSTFQQVADNFTATME